jgi:hypothetical protein
MDNTNYIDLFIKLFDDSQGELAKVRQTITVDTLIQEILNEFRNELDLETPETYGLYRENDPHPLSRSLQIGELDLRPQDELTFRRLRFTGREDIQGKQIPVLRNTQDRSLRFHITWQPALIGRPDSYALHNKLLAVDVEPLPGGLLISRRHAQIIQDGENFFLERLSNRNPTYLNEREIPPIGRHPLTPGARIRLGRAKSPGKRVEFIFVLIDRDQLPKQPSGNHQDEGNG